MFLLLFVSAIPLFLIILLFLFFIKRKYRQVSHARYRVVHITNIPTPYRIAFFNLLSSKLNSRGIDIIVIYASWHEPRRLFSCDSLKLEYPWINLHAWPIDLGFFVFWVDLKIIWHLSRLRPNLVLCAGSWNLLPSLISSLFPLGYLKAFWSEGHQDSVLHSQGLISRIRKWALNRYDTFVVPNESSEAYIMAQLRGGASSKNFIYLPNVIDEEVFSEFCCHIESSFQRRLVIVAALEARKGWLEFLDALELLPRSALSRIQLHICGEGCMRDSLSLRLESLKCDFTLYGQQSPDFVANLLSRSHGFLLPSLCDPNPLSVIEALCVGVPLLLSTSCGNHRECVQYLINGWTFDPSKSQEISNCLLAWLNSDIDSLRNMSEASRSIYNDSFRSEPVCDRFVDDVSSLLRIPIDLC